MMSIDRRDFLFALGASMTAPSLAHAASADKQPPNVIVMICDDLGYGDLGCYGSHLPTPNLDRIAREGVRCTHYNSAHPICSASRAALMTGRYAARSHTIGAYFPHAKSGMSVQETTLGNLFHDRGYRTQAIGKWHLGDAPEYLPTSRGFDHYFGVPVSDDMQPLNLIRDKQVLQDDADRDTLTQQYTHEAVRFLSEKSSRPFFLYMAFSYPHDPARASKEFRGKSGFGDYGDAVHEIDWSVGQVMKALEETGAADNTLVLFTSDHGPWFQGSAGLLRGRKGSTFEGGFRVPFLAHWKNRLPAGHVVEEWMSNMDVLPTLRAWCGLEQPKLPLDGVDASALLAGKVTKLERKPVLYFTPAGEQSDIHCIRSGDWKMRVAQNFGEIYTNDHTMERHSAWLPRPELYHLRRDFAESYDVAKEHPETVKEMLAELDRQIETFPQFVKDSYAKLKQSKASVVTPPGACPRILTKPLPNWAWEPEDRRPS